MAEIDSEGVRELAIERVAVTEMDLEPEVDKVSVALELWDGGRVAVTDKIPLNEGKEGLKSADVDTEAVPDRVSVTLELKLAGLEAERVIDTVTLGLPEVLEERVAVREGVGVRDGVGVGERLHTLAPKDVWVSQKAVPPSPPPPVPEYVTRLRSL